MRELQVSAIALGTGLAIGLVVGLERGWRARETAEGRRVAGLRTFALIGLFGALLAMPGLPDVLVATGLACIALLFVVSYRHEVDRAGTLSITSGVAALVTYALGAVAARGQPVVALGGAVIVALLLDLKEELHGWLRSLQPSELDAALQLGVITAVVLPLLPNEGYGPYHALNPFKLWLAVIVVATVSLLGHVAVRLRGQQQGLLWVGLLGGLASSTAATLTLAQLARTHRELARTACAAIIAASAVMFIRMAIVVSVLEPSLSLSLGGLLMWLAAATAAVAAWFWRGRERAPEPAQRAAPGRVFDLRAALVFGGALGLITLLVRAAHERLGSGGVYAVSFLSGLADVDAIVISAVQMHAQGMVAALPTMIAILLAALANTVVKAAMAWVVAGPTVGPRVSAGFLAALALGSAPALARFL